jgi:hypothetical protein
MLEENKSKYGIILTPTLKHPSGRYLIHSMELHTKNLGDDILVYYDNYGQSYHFANNFSVDYQLLTIVGREEKNIIRNTQYRPIPYPNGNMSDFILYPNILDYTMPLSNDLIDFVKSQTHPIKNLNQLANLIR